MISVSIVVSIPKLSAVENDFNTSPKFPPLVKDSYLYSFNELICILTLSKPAFFNFRPCSENLITLVVKLTSSILK